MIGHLFLTKSVFDSVWYHESSQFSLIAIDAITDYNNKCLQVGLFEYNLSNNSANNSIAVKDTKPMRRYSSIFGKSNTKVNQRTTLYTIDISYDTKRYRYELHNEFDCSILTIKLLGSLLMLGGTNGFIGWCVLPNVSHPSTKLEGTLTVQPAYKSIIRTNEDSIIGSHHLSTAKITTIATSSELSFFAVGDDHGYVSLWYIDNTIAEEPKMLDIHNFDIIKGLQPENIKSLNFLTKNIGNELIISTNQRLLIVRIAPDAGYRTDFKFYGYSQLDFIEKTSQVIYSISINETKVNNIINNQLIVWKVSCKNDILVASAIKNTNAINNNNNNKVVSIVSRFVLTMDDINYARFHFIKIEY